MRTGLPRQGEGGNARRLSTSRGNARAASRPGRPSPFKGEVGRGMGSIARRRNDHGLRRPEFPNRPAAGLRCLRAVHADLVCRPTAFAVAPHPHPGPPLEGEGENANRPSPSRGAWKCTPAVLFEGSEETRAGRPLRGGKNARAASRPGRPLPLQGGGWEGDGVDRAASRQRWASPSRISQSTSSGPALPAHAVRADLVCRSTAFAVAPHPHPIPTPALPLTGREKMRTGLPLRGERGNARRLSTSKSGKKCEPRRPPGEAGNSPRCNAPTTHRVVRSSAAADNCRLEEASKPAPACPIAPPSRSSTSVANCL